MLSKDKATKVRILLVQRKSEIISVSFQTTPGNHVLTSKGLSSICLQAEARRVIVTEIYPCWPENEPKSWLKSQLKEDTTGERCPNEKNKFCRFYLN